MTTETRPEEPGYSGREGDARADVDEFRNEISPIVFKPNQDVPKAYSRFGSLNPKKLFTGAAPPQLTPDEQSQAAQALQEALDANQVRYPQFAQTLLNDPSKIWLMAEIQLMLSPEPNEVSYDFTGELTEAIGDVETGARTKYEYETSKNETQQLFWNDYGSKYGDEERSLFIDALSQLSPIGANRVAAMGIAWADNKDMEDEENRAQFVLNMFQWAQGEQQHELGESNPFFQALDAAQEFVERNAIQPMVNAGVGLLSGAEEAARRRDLTAGQQVAYQMGLRPPDEVGEFGWWTAVSGGIDGTVEIVGDPLNVLAGIGAGAKAIKTIPMANKATRAGRAAMATRALLPRSFTGATRQVRGGRTARVLYSLRAKTVDDLLDNTVKNGVAEQALNLIKSDNPVRFQRMFPAWGRMPDEMYRTIQETVESPEEFVEVLKAGSLNEVLNTGRKLEDLEMVAEESWEAARRYIGEEAVDETEVLGALNRWASDTGNVQIKTSLSRILDGDEIDDLASNEARVLVNAFLDDAVPQQRLYRIGNEAASTVDNLSVGDDIVFNLESAANKRGTFWQENFRHSDLSERKVAYEIRDAPGLRNPTNEIEAEYLFSGRFRIAEINPEGRSGVVVLEYIDDVLEPQTLQKTGKADLLMHENIPRDIRLNAAKNQLALDVFNAKPGRAFIISDVPEKAKKVFSWQKVMDRTEGTGRLARGVRRTAARITPGRPDDNIELFNTRRGLVQLQRLFEHFGMRQSKIDELLNEFRELDLGARQDWFWDRGMRELGAEIQVPAYQLNLVQFYKGGGIRKFAGSNADTWVDLSGKAHRAPILPSQFNPKMPIPLEELEKTFRRASSIGNRSKISRVMGWNGRGLGSTKTKRVKLVKRLRDQLGDEAADMTDEDLYELAYSMVSPNIGMDGRGRAAGWLAPKAGNFFNGLHRAFTKMMLVGRPIQWMWRVALLEEPIRAHMFNMPSLYTNPLQYMERARSAHYLSNLTKWAEVNSAWGHDIYRTLTKGAGKEELIKRVDDVGLRSDIFADLPLDELSLPELRTGISRFIQDAVYGRTRINKVSPIKKVPWAVKNRSRSIATAEKALDKFSLPKTFDFANEAAEINQKILAGYLGEAVGTADRKAYQWAEGMMQSEAYTHGQVWAQNMIQMVEDTYGRMGVRRLAARLRGADVDEAVSAEAIINSSKWDLMRHDLAMRFDDTVGDLALAQRYMDEVVTPEVEHLFRPFLDDLDPEDAADLLDEFARTHQISGRLGGVDFEWNLTGANYGSGTREVGDFVASARDNPLVKIPSDLPAVSLDPRMMAGDSKNFVNRIADWTLQTFGEEATQNLNRRPAWIHEYKRWFDNYTGIGVPTETAERLAIDNANRMVNYVFFNMDEAPYYAAKLNQFVPFFGATYEVLATWAYKMPTAAGGYWPMGVGEFARKFDRLMDAFVNTGLVSREQDDDGGITYTLNLVPPDSSVASNKELGRALQGAGFAAVNTLDQVISTILGLEEGLGLRSQGYRLALGHPLNPTDYGMLSYAQFHVGLNPLTNIAVSTAAALYPGATGPQRTPVAQGETLADVVNRLDIDVNDIVRYNRELFVDTENFGSSALYNGLLAGEVDPETLDLPADTILNLPQSSLFDAFEDVFMPFGSLDSPQEFVLNYLPGTMRWLLGGLALQNQPTDEFWKDSDMEGIFGGLLPSINEAQVSSQLNEAFMYLEAHDLVNGKGPFTRIQEKETRLQKLLDTGKTEEANALRNELQLDTEAFLSRAQKVAAESLILRSLTGQMMPSSPGHVRKEQELIQQYWDTLDYADSIKAGDGVAPKLANFKSMEEVDNYYEQLAAWLNDPTGDRARATFRDNYPQLQAYLTPKTFYKEPVPDIQSYEEYQRQIESGEREPAPLHVTMWRARSANIQADYYNKYIATFGSDPMQAAANALNERQTYQELQDERNGAYQGLEMWDDMHGGVYDNWRTENYQDIETWAQDQVNDKLNTVRDNLSMLFELEDNLEIELDLEGIANLNGSVRGAIAEISKAIREYRELTEETGTKNAYEEAINQYFEQVYIPYSEEISALYDRLPEVADSEKQSLIYEQIKFAKNQFANSTVFLNDDTTVPFPNPLEYSWQGKPEEERLVKTQQWLTRPLEWIDQDQAIRIVEANPIMDRYLPTGDAEFDIYREFTLAKIEVDEMFEVNEITRSQRNKAMESLDEQLVHRLLLSGREGEVEFMNLTPYEKLELAELLPGELGIFGDNVRFYKQILEAKEESAGTIVGRQIVDPLYNQVEEAFYSDPSMRSAIQELGINLQDDDTLDNFLPWLFFGYSGER